MGKGIVKIGLVVVLWEKCCTVGEKKNNKTVLQSKWAGQLPGETLELVWWFWKWSGTGSLWHFSLIRIIVFPVTWITLSFTSWKPFSVPFSHWSLFWPVLQIVILLCFFFSVTLPSHVLFTYVNCIFYVSFSFLLEGKLQESRYAFVGWCISNAYKVHGSRS